MEGEEGMIACGCLRSKVKGRDVSAHFKYTFLVCEKEAVYDKPLILSTHTNTHT